MKIDNKDPKVISAALKIGEMCEKIEKLFKGDTKVTVLVRNPDFGDDSDMITTNDDLEMVKQAITRLQEREKQ